MEITFAATPSWEDDISILSIKTEEDESIYVGQKINIELIDGSFVEKEIDSMEMLVCSKDSKRGKWKKVDKIENGESAEVTIKDLFSGDVQTTSMPSREKQEKIDKMICLTPYKELKSGEESIFDHVKEGYKVPDKVIAYLRTRKPFSMSSDIYNNLFKESMRLCGPYLYTDDIYYWDRDTWKYVVKYGLELSQEFIDHVMSEAGTEFIDKQIKENESWSKVLKEWKENRKNILVLVDPNEDDDPLDDF